MPTYDLKCQDCGECSERFLMRLIRDEDRVCQSCGSTRVTTGPGGRFLSFGRSGSIGSETCGSGGFT